MPKLILKHTKPNAETSWVLPVSPYHLNCVGEEDTTTVTAGMAVVEDATHYPGRTNTEVEVISDTEIKITYIFDTIENRNAARTTLHNFHVKCQSITTKNIPEIEPFDYVILSIID